MKRLLGLLLCLLAGSASAQTAMVPCVTQVNSGGFSSCAPVTATNALPVTVYSNATSGFVLTSNGSGAATFQASSGGGGTPGGLSGSLQYNNAGSFGGVGTYFTSGSPLSGGAYMDLFANSNAIIDDSGNMAMTSDVAFSGGNVITASSFSARTAPLVLGADGSIGNNSNLSWFIYSSGDAHFNSVFLGPGGLSGSGINIGSNGDLSATSLTANDNAGHPSQVACYYSQGLLGYCQSDPSSGNGSCTCSPP